ncbi:MAG: hypothetical protein L3J69_02440 [Desulfobacula sp.]|nr:hypothetical protein [Desulfobacula sp.]
MKRNILIFLFILLLIPAEKGEAKNEISAMESLTIELWPDYDRPSVLVLLTGQLPADTQFPATVIIPLPENAQLNAIARIDDRDGIMKDDIPSAPGPSNMLMFITTDLQFRVEYYMPYIVNGSQRLFDYTWLSDIAVNNLQLKIQQPKAAKSFNIKPAAMDIMTGGGGLTYHTFPPKTVLPGQSFSVHLEYEMTTIQLSANILPLQSSDAQMLVSSPQPATGTPTNWTTLIIIVGGFLVLIGLVWLIMSRRSQVDTHERHSQKTKKQLLAKFCHDLGEPVDETDKWCGQCGQNL